MRLGGFQAHDDPLTVVQGLNRKNMKITPDMLQGPDADEISALLVITKAEILVPNLFKPKLEIRRPDGATVRVPAEMTIEGWREAFKWLLDMPQVAHDSLVGSATDLTKHLKGYASSRAAPAPSGVDTDKVMNAKIKELTGEITSQLEELQQRAAEAQYCGASPVKVVSKLIGASPADTAKAMAGMWGDRAIAKD